MKFPYVWKFKNTFLSNSSQRKYYSEKLTIAELNDNENVSYQLLWAVRKVRVRRKCIDVNTWKRRTPKE